MKINRWVNKALSVHVGLLHRQYPTYEIWVGLLLFFFAFGELRREQLAFVRITQNY